MLRRSGRLPPILGPVSQTCHQCGAPVRTADVHCRYCGARLAGAAPDAAEVARARLARAGELRGYAEAMAHVPPLAGHKMGSYVGVGCFGAWSLAAAGMGFFASFGVGPLGGFALPFVLVPLLMAAFGVFAAVTLWRKTAPIRSGEFHREPVLVVAKRSEHGDKSTSYFVTVEHQSGERHESLVDGRVHGRLQEGDLGIAYSAGEFMLDFKRLSE